MSVKNMYASQSYSAFFVKTGAVFVIQRISGVIACGDEQSKYLPD